MSGLIWIQTVLHFYNKLNLEKNKKTTKISQQAIAGHTGCVKDLIFCPAVINAGFQTITLKFGDIQLTCQLLGCPEELSPHQLPYI